MIRVRVRQEEEPVLATHAREVEESAAMEFELEAPRLERRARELYEVDRAR